MKSTGIVRRVDELGRIVIPKETRDILFIREGDSLEIFRDEKDIVLRKYAPGCAFCGDMRELKEFKGMYVCKKCLESIKSIKE